jgi:hypothetical protein
VKSDYTEADIKSSTVDGKIYQIKMVDDMGVLYYRKSILDKAGVKPPTTIDELIAASKALNTKDQKGLFIGNDAGVTPSFGGGSLLGTILWTVGADYLTADNKPGFTTPEVKQSFAKMRDSRVGGVPWSAPSRPTSMPPKPSSSGYGSTTPRTKRTSTSVTASISRLASRWPATAAKLQSGPAADALKIFNENAVASNPAWTPKMNNAYADAATEIVRKGGDIDANLAKAEKAVNAELNRLFG